MNRFNNIIKATAILVLSGFVSCVEVEEQGSAVGYLVSPALDVDVTVDDPAQTKAIDFEIEAPAVSDVHFVVKDKDGNVKYSGEGLWSEPLVMPVGAYTVEASAGENGFGKPYFTGSASGSISPLDNEVPALSLALGNALVNVTVHSDFAQHFTGEKVVVGAGALEANFGEWFYVPSGSALALTLSGKNSAGKDAAFTYSLGAPAAKTAYSVVCKATSNNWPSIEWRTDTPLSDGAFEGGLYFKPVVVSNMSDINAAAVAYQIKGGDYSDWTNVTVSDVAGYKYISGLANSTEYKLRAYVGNIFSAEQTFAPVTYASCLRTEVTAAHNNADPDKSSDMLESTAVKAAVSAYLPAIVAELATSHTASVTFGNGRVKQSTLNVNAAKQTLSNADGWPYLPQGPYAYTATATLALPDARTLTAPLSGSVTVPAPEFSLTLSAYTSYDKYAATNGITKDLNGTTGANNCDPATLYNAGGQWGISTAIMANANYAKTLVINIDGNTDRTINVTDNKYYYNISSLSWQAHTLAVSVTFDGKTVTKTQTHHITGLPYVLTHPAQGWSIVENGVVTYTYFGDNYIFLTSDSSTGSVKTPDFHIPGNVDISVSTTFKRIRDGILTDWTFSVHTYDSNGNASQIDSHKGNGKNTTHTIGGDATFTPSCYNVLCRRYYWAGSGPDAQITDFTIDYR